MPSLTALCLLFVIAEILRPVKANIILALLSVDCLEPNRVKKKKIKIKSKYNGSFYNM